VERPKWEQDALDFLTKVEAGEYPFWSLGLGPRVDQRMGGLEQGHFTVIAAPNKRGKTALVVNMVHAALMSEEKPKVLVFTTETTGLWFAMKVAGRHLGFDVSRLRRKNCDVTTEEFTKLRNAVSAVVDVGLIMEDVQLPPAHVVEDWIAEYNPDLVFLDHFQRMDGENESEVVGNKKLAQKLKGMAVNYNCCVVCMSQARKDPGWSVVRDGIWEYDLDKMRTAWTNEIQAEADKLVFWDWLKESHPNQGHLIYHSLRDYPSDGYTELFVDMEKMYINEQPPPAIGEPV